MNDNPNPKGTHCLIRVRLTQAEQAILMELGLGIDETGQIVPEE